MPSFRRSKRGREERKEDGNEKVVENTNSDETVLAECSNFQRRRSVLGKLQHERNEDRINSVIPPSLSPSPPPSPSPTLSLSPQIPPRTFLDDEGGTPVSASLNGSIAQRRRQGEYFHRPPVWSILPMRADGSGPSSGSNNSNSDSDSDSCSGSDSDAEGGLIALNRLPNDIPVTAGMHEEACQFCLGRLPESIVSRSLPVGGEAGSERDRMSSSEDDEDDDVVERAFETNNNVAENAGVIEANDGIQEQEPCSDAKGPRVGVQNGGNESRVHWLKRFRSFTSRRHGRLTSDREEKPAGGVGLRRRLRSTLRKRSQSQPHSFNGSSDYTGGRKNMSGCLSPVPSHADEPKSG